MYYNFDESSNEGRDSINVKVKDFCYTVSLKKKEENLPIVEIYEKYRNDALSAAAYKIRCNMALESGNIYF